MKTLQESSFRNYSGVILEILYPSLCEVCQKEYISLHNLFCFKCFTKLPFLLQNDATAYSLKQHFDESIVIELLTTMFVLNPDSGISRIIHRLKYKGVPKLGFELGKMFGEILDKDLGFRKIDCIVPVPLHPKKLRIRGYNQSQFIASGISKATGIPIEKGILKRVVATKTQTRMNRIQRLKNMQNAFALDKTKMENPLYQHFLLVDDVLTTGSTLTGCAKKLLTINGAKVSMLTIAMGK